MELMSIGKFAKALGVSTHTLRVWHKEGELIPQSVTKGGTRYYSAAQLNDFTNKGEIVRAKKVVGYARVSTQSQKDDLENQIINIKSYMFAKGYQFDIITDIGSGINYNKKGLKELIRLINNREISRVVILYKDRLIRFGYELIEYFCLLNGVELEIIDSSEKSKEKELTDDLIQIITVFANRLYGSRSKKTKQLIDGVTDVTNQKNTDNTD